jgi:hypothetical protein
MHLKLVVTAFVFTCVDPWFFLAFFATFASAVSNGDADTYPKSNHTRSSRAGSRYNLPTQDGTTTKAPKHERTAAGGSVSHP